jgi:hypothetical protein
MICEVQRQYTKARLDYSVSGSWLEPRLPVAHLFHGSERDVKQSEVYEGSRPDPAAWKGSALVLHDDCVKLYFVEIPFLAHPAYRLNGRKVGGIFRRQSFSLFYNHEQVTPK